MLRRAFADSSEASDELALSKAGLIIPKATPKVSPFIKKGIFIAAPEQEKPAKENPKATESFSQESGIVLERMGDASSKPQRAHREPRIPRENKKPQPASTVALPTQAEQLDNKIPEYIFPSKNL